jgi:hypothetical protein
MDSFASMYTTFHFHNCEYSYLEVHNLTCIESLICNLEDNHCINLSINHQHSCRVGQAWESNRDMTHAINVKNWPGTVTFSQLIKFSLRWIYQVGRLWLLARYMNIHNFTLRLPWWSILYSRSWGEPPLLEYPHLDLQLIISHSRGQCPSVSL